MSGGMVAQQAFGSDLKGHFGWQPKSTGWQPALPRIAERFASMVFLVRRVARTVSDGTGAGALLRRSLNHMMTT